MKTDIPMVDYPESFGKKVRKKLVYISPLQFLEMCKFTSMKRNQREMNLNMYIRNIIVKSSIKKIKQGLQSGTNVIPLPYIETVLGVPFNHEGRNRAIAAMELGIQKIPVILIGNTNSYIEKNPIKYLKNRGFSLNEIKKRKIW